MMISRHVVAWERVAIVLNVLDDYETIDASAVPKWRGDKVWWEAFTFDGTKRLSPRHFDTPEAVARWFDAQAEKEGK